MYHIENMNIRTMEIAERTTVAEIMYRNARKYPKKEAIVFKDKRLTFRELDELSNQVANFVVGLGVKKGDRVAILMRNSEKFPAVYFGVLKAGAVIICINISFMKPEVKYILEDSGAKLLIFDEFFGPVLKGLPQETPGVDNFVCVGENPPEGTLGYFDLMAKSSTDRPPVRVTENDPCSIIYTSGTTGSPRGALFDHRAVVYNASVVGVINHGFRHFSRSLIMMPLFHSAPLHNHFLGTSFVGGTNVILEAFDPKLFLETIQEEKTTHFFGPVVVYLTCLKLLDVKQYDLSSMQLFVMGGSPASSEDQARIIEEFGLKGRFQQVYGLTESGPAGNALFSEEIELKPRALGLNGCLGGELIIVDKDLNKIEEPGVVGELAVFCESHMVGYFNDPEKTANTLINGWILTGDLAMYDEDEYIYFVDRSKDMIISGGQNVYSKEIEDVIMGHPAVMEVAVIGAPHPEWGESVKAVVSLRPGATATPEEIKTFCADKLAKFKRPRYVQIVEAIPHNPAGKIVKPEIRKLYGQAEDKAL
ncbi:MAG: AMP-binding protein [Syntrophomonadales bacterium]